MKRIKTIGSWIAVAGGLICFIGLLAESITALGIGFGIVLIGLLPYVINPVLPNQRGWHASSVQPALTVGRKQYPGKGDTHDRRTGDPRYN